MEMYFYTLFYILFTYVRCELFTSLATMEHGLMAEQNMADKIREYISKEKERLHALDRLADSFDEHSRLGLKNPNAYLGNPINAFLFVKKFTIDWEKYVEESIKHKQTQVTTEFNTDLDRLRKRLPDEEDLTGSVQAILRLQDMYDIPAKEIAEGSIGGLNTGELSADACFELGRIAYEDGDYYHGFHWMAIAKERLEKERNKTTEMSDVLDYMAWTAHELENDKLALELTEELIKLVPDHLRAKNNRQDFIERVKKASNDTSRVKRDLTNTTHYVPKPTPEYNGTPELRSYKRLCKGLDVKPREKMSSIVCRYRHNNNPRLLLSPIKEEEVYRDANMVLFHDIASDKEMKIIRSLAIPKLFRATVHDPTTGKLIHAKYRITKTAWLEDRDHSVVERVQNRIKAVTGLDLDSADSLQVANYGIGGHYDPHYDFSTRDDEDTSELEKRDGNRIATFLLYMTDVDAGGATVFPIIDVRVLPKKGTAVFWYNLRRSGKGIMETRHAACPVLVGTKWVSNKWIRTRGQEFRRPCGLTEDE
ncbi:prolyl 4-hydroxylase subunit alpha-1-like [Mytilus californianus]|uniref:prolyl 4-hydroxylase subunit alpha-1-like n=1 Tax=Mytilus californianus TaxID=6549 RepID=UPI002246A5E4|nr:prolyl 4-hydroxylase subunit alpha-1-like [Mytilus californianus]